MKIKVDVPEGIELPLERARMERVFLNLIDNSLGMMPVGGTLSITAKAEASSVTVSVRDSGPGIPSQVRARLFQPFVSAGKKNGIGLGLAFSHQTVLDHGGKLWADADTRKGPAFSFSCRSKRAGSIRRGKTLNDAGRCIVPYATALLKVQVSAHCAPLSRLIT